MDASQFNPEYFNSFGKGSLPDHLGIVVTGVREGEIVAEFAVTPQHLAPNGYLHAGSVVTLADTACGYACFSHLPEGGQSFTTIELKSNHLGTARDGVVVATAKAVHLGRTTQVWDAIVSNKETGKTIALFRCTQMILFPKQG
ncbi:PaaI family thioesterase [Duganella vulcania]|uniref:Hotdog fold thioesterase n=1 Tax=Duganella vulcania TaxID=2692166 RepID=A0A845GYG5_9BURK|nr:PaaI family thioesterase [Duganella vulcania]MYM98298.1 hotdog fold thioesterase [Duganella vulcania]